MKRQERHLYLRSAVACLLCQRRALLFLLPLLLLLCVVGRLRADDTTRDVQEELRKRNLYFGDVDGRRTPQLIAALRHYQDHKGFPSTGEMDDETLRSLSLRPAQPMGFAPPAAAMSISNPNPASAGDASGSGNTPASLQEVTVPYWPDTPVLRSDTGHGGPPGPALAAALNNLMPGMADQISPPARFTTVPSASFAPDKGPAAADVRDFITRYLRAGQTNAPDAELAFYGSQVKYFNEGTVDRHFIAQDIRRYETRWPQRSFTLIGSINAVADANNFDHTLVHFRYRFTNKNSRFTVNGEVDNVFTLEGSGPDSLRIISLSERHVR